jgi:hypothetical protein
VDIKLEGVLVAQCANGSAGCWVDQAAGLLPQQWNYDIPASFFAALARGSGIRRSGHRLMLPLAADSWDTAGVNHEDIRPFNPYHPMQVNCGKGGVKSLWDKPLL